MKVFETRFIPFEFTFLQAWQSTTEAVAVRKGLFLHILFANGGFGRGEVLLWNGFGDGEERARKDVGRVAIELSEQRFDSWPFPSATEVWLGSLGKEVRGAVEMAVLDAMAQRQNVPLWKFLGGSNGKGEQPLRHFLTDASLDTAIPHASAYKMKGSPTVTETLGRVREFRTLLGTNAHLTIDANQGWKREDWLENRCQWKDLEPLCIEEPCPFWWVDESESPSPLSIAADEALHTVPLEIVLALPSVTTLTLKPLFLGGATPTLKMAERIREAGKTAVVSSCLGTQLERSFSLQIASRCGEGTVFGLGPLLSDSLMTSSLRIHRNGMPLPGSPGLGLRTPQWGVGHSRLAPTRSGFSGSKNAIMWKDTSTSLTHVEWDLCIQQRAEEGFRAGVQSGMVGVIVEEDPLQWTLIWRALDWLGAVGVPFKNDPKTRALDVSQSVGASFIWHRHGVEGPALLPPAPLSHLPSAHRWARGDVRLLAFTSGTTGKSVVQPITHDQLITSALTSAIRLGHNANDRWLLTLPLHRIGGVSIVERAHIYGTGIVSPPDHQPSTLVAWMENEEVTHISLVPPQLEGLLDTLEVSGVPSKLRAVLVGGGPTARATLARARSLGVPLCRTWGMTESASQLATETPGSSGAEPGLNPQLFTEISLDDHGRLLVQGPTVGGQHLTGDWGSLTDSGAVCVEGRVEDVLISGGVNVRPDDIEHLLRDHQSVEDAAVFGIEDATWGERVVALILPCEPEAPALEVALREWCATHLPAAQRPKEYHFVEKQFRNDMGKIPRKQLRDWLLEGRRTA